MAEALSGLPDRRLGEIMAARLGLRGDARTLQAIGDHLGVSRERVRQLQNKAAGRLVRRARQPGTPGASLATLLERHGGDGSDEEFADRIYELAATTFTVSQRTSLPLLLAAAGFYRADATRIAALALQRASARSASAKADQRAEGGRAERWVARWLAHTHWPADPGSPPSRDSLRASRGIEMDELAGLYPSTKLGRKVAFESGLERNVIDALEHCERIAYFQEQPCVVDYHYGTRARRYHPDLLIVTDDGRTVLIEVKPLWEIALSINRAKARAARSMAHRNGWGWLSVAGLRTERDLIDRTIPPSGHHALSTALAANGSLSWAQVQALRERSELRLVDVSAYALQHDVHLQLMPYRLGTPPLPAPR
ncbi:TnsA endonuclease N-terminal domain-containing protein [Actinomadura sp. NPDC048021]|uniref:TnsA endonuclease N-terminal domain-containing protein n=1 Tax=Actinomadura sp. NPDC048021 TaxID=3155385 RepID=UPI0033EC89BE